jgi:centromeric protein E
MTRSESKAYVQVRPLSPTKLGGPELGYDKSAAQVSIVCPPPSRLHPSPPVAPRRAHPQLRENLHAAERKISQLHDDNIRLKYELAARSDKPDERIMTLMDEVAGLKMIAEDYERNLLEPSRKVREDVEREWKAKVERLEGQLESKQVWAVRLDERVRGLTRENEAMKAVSAGHSVGRGTCGRWG